MGDKTSIEWTDASWSPIAAFRHDTGRRGWHCEKVSEGCRGCYAEKFNGRKLQVGTGLPYTRASRDLVEIRAVNLDVPLRWRKGRRIFVESMSDLFADFVPDELIDQVFAVMALAPQHAFQVLTKRPERMRAYLTNVGAEYLVERWAAAACEITDSPCSAGYVEDATDDASAMLPNVWLGTSVEDQPTADLRIPEVLATPAARRFVSYEPALGPVDFTRFLAPPFRASYSDGRGGVSHHVNAEDAAALAQLARAAVARDGLHFLDWVIVGGESGPGARPFDVAWARQTIAACKAAGVPVFVKQLGSVPVMRLDEFNVTEGWGEAVHSGEYCGGPLDDWPGMTRFGTKPHEYVRIRQLRDRKGGSMDEWPSDLRVREMPEPRP